MCKPQHFYTVSDYQKIPKKTGWGWKPRHANTAARTNKHRSSLVKHTVFNPSKVACSISVRRRQTRANGRTVETGHDGVLTAVPRIVIGTPDGAKTGHRGRRVGWGGVRDTGRRGEIEEEEEEERQLTG